MTSSPCPALTVAIGLGRTAALRLESATAAALYEAGLAGELGALFDRPGGHMYEVRIERHDGMSLPRLPAPLRRRIEALAKEHTA